MRTAFIASLALAISSGTTVAGNGPWSAPAADGDAALSDIVQRVMQPNDPAQVIEPQPPSLPPRTDPFAAKQWLLQVNGSGAWTAAGDIYAVHVGLGIHLWDRISMNVEAFGGYLDVDTPPDVSGDAGIAGLDAIFRWHFLHQRSCTVFLDVGPGAAWHSEKFPFGATDYNFRAQFGLGATVHRGDDFHLIGGARWLHMSNAFTSGRNRNPGADGMVVWLGVMRPF